MMARLEGICAINMGQSPDSSTYNEDGNGLPFFQGNADFGEIYPAVRMWCSEPTKIAREKDILISVRAPIGALNIAKCECCIGRGLAALTVNEDICAQKYLWHALSGKVDELNSKGTGSTFKAINKKTLSVFVHLSNYIIDTQYKNDPQHIKHVKDIFPDVPQNVYLSMLANEFLKMNIAPDVGLFPRALAETMKESQLCIFKAKGSVFVTSDMPVVNIYGEKDGIEYDLLGMPITPELFLAFVDTVQRVPRIIIIDDNSVKRMNSKQINKDLLISNRIDLLSYIDFSIDAEKEDDEQVYQLLHTDKETALKQYEDMMSSKEIKYWG